MVRVTLTFVIALPYQINPWLIFAKKNKREEKKGKKKKISTVELEEENNPLEDTHFIDCDPKMKYFCTIRYKLMPNYNETILSIVCWGKVAKIYLKEQIKAVKTIVRNNVGWIAFSVSHKVKSIKNNQAAKFLAHKVEFLFSHSAKDVIQKAQSDQRQLFYSFKEEELIDNVFEVLSPTTNRDEIPQPVIPVKKEKLYNKFISEKTENSVLLFGIPCILHRKKVTDKINKSQAVLRRMGLPPNVADVIEQLQQSMYNRRSRASKTKRENEEALGEGIVFSGEELLFDKFIWFKEKFSLTNQILYGGIWLTSDSLINEDVRNILQPIGIRIKKLEHMPIRDSIYRKCKKISVEYSLGTIIKNTDIIPVTISRNSKSVLIDNTQLFFTNDIPAEKLIENFQTSKIVFKIYGYFRDTSHTYGAIFTELLEDGQFSKRVTTKIYPDFDLSKKYKETEQPRRSQQQEEILDKVFLGLALVDCNDLINGNYRMDITAPIVSGSILNESSSTTSLIGNFNTLAVYDDTPAVKGALHDGQLIENGSSIKVRIRVLGLMKPKIMKAREFPGLLTRFFAILTNPALASSVLKKIFNHNGSLLGEMFFIPCIPFYKGDEIKSALSYNNSTSKENDGKQSAQLITGFLVDAFDVLLLFVEGLEDVIIPEVWNKLFTLETQQGSILYHSDLIFTERLYPDFINFGGVYVITLAVTLDSLLSKSKSFLEGFIPNPAWRALISIKRLLTCKTMQTAVQQKLFPTSQELICMDMEFGVPLYRKKLFL